MKNYKFFGGGPGIMRFSPYGGTCPRIVDFLRLGIIPDVRMRHTASEYRKGGVHNDERYRINSIL